MYVDQLEKTSLKTFYDLLISPCSVPLLRDLRDELLAKVTDVTEEVKLLQFFFH